MNYDESVIEIAFALIYHFAFEFASEEPDQGWGKFPSLDHLTAG
jgi:hypothetical protein